MDDVTVDELFEYYQQDMTTLLDKHAPRYVRKRKQRILTPWFDKECRTSKRRVRQLERKYFKTKNVVTRRARIDKLQEQAVFFRDKERIYWLSRIASNSQSSRKLWKDMDTVMCRIEEAETPTLDDINRAEDFSTFFKNKVEKI